MDAAARVPAHKESNFRHGFYEFDFGAQRFSAAFKRSFDGRL
jgi:hypothetical protein